MLIEIDEQTHAMIMNGFSAIKILSDAAQAKYVAAVQQTQEVAKPEALKVSETTS